MWNADKLNRTYSLSMFSGDVLEPTGGDAEDVKAWLEDLNRSVSLFTLTMLPWWTWRVVSSSSRPMSAPINLAIILSAVYLP